ncbi:MAG: bifunctional metallophosphatase/5'-nucleotidase [Chitinophagaceae bacterium]|nr:bifunctional metallophosphatase/5'-nucleotidase [Chitinophagaceae bacterium]
MARVATLKKEYLRKNPNTFLVMAGDFLSPSVYNSLRYEGKAIRGRQMIESMNAAGFDFVIFGNHEFDIKESEVQQRINESDFQWISSNTFHLQGGKAGPFAKNKSGQPVQPFPETYIQTITDADGTTARIGYIGLTLPFNKSDYVSYTDVISTAKKGYNQLKDSVDAVVALTHQSVEEDENLAREIPGLALIIGGHEHDQRFSKVGNIYITKAMANAKSAYVLTLRFNKNRHTLKVKPKLVKINEGVALDSTTDLVVQKWVGIANKSYSSLGFDAAKVVLSDKEPLDGRETEIRSGSTNLTKLIIASMIKASPTADVVIANAGSIRVDDILTMPVTQYDIIRTLPFGGGIKEVEMKGGLLIRILESGLKNKGTGGFLQYNETLRRDDISGQWQLNNIPLDPGKNYRVAITEFLLTGGEANMEYLKPGNPDMLKVTDFPSSDRRFDIRKTIIDYLEAAK